MRAQGAVSWGLAQPRPGVRPPRRDDDGVEGIDREGHALSGPREGPGGGRDP
ncbi:MAG: hypothetical protein OXC62_15635 [Aestuariivita sp.]|nr:hypothetical protein [Aestuariivita sp.]